MTCHGRIALTLFATACGPAIGDDGSAGTGDAAELDCASIPEDTLKARLVIGRGTPTIELLQGPPGEVGPPFACDDPMPRCGYVLSRLVPLDDIAPGTFSVPDGTLDHTGELCSVGDDDEAFDTFDEPEAVLEIHAVAEACISGHYAGESVAWDFVAERCDF